MTSLQETTQEQASAFKEFGDLHPLVCARVVCEWARIDSLFPMRFWGNEMLGSHVTLGLDRWYVGRDDKNARMVLQITWHKGALGGPEKAEYTWRLDVQELTEKGNKAGLVAY